LTFAGSETADILILCSVIENFAGSETCAMIYIIFQEAVGGRALSIFKEKQQDPLYNIKKRCRLF
jgi:hypothetical protein